MPELPEVETIKNQLAPHLTGRTFKSIKIYDTRPLGNLSEKEFGRRLTGQKITGLSRCGKYILIHLSGGSALVVHLRMTGSLLWNPRSAEPFTRAEFFFENKGRLVFTDIRRFGTLSIVEDTCKIKDRLGIDPLDTCFTPQALQKLLSGRKSPVKAVLLEQELIAGIGNMYADEALFAARIHPAIPAQSLSTGEVKRLHKAIQDVLKKAIRNKGASVRNYRCPDGQAGRAHEEFCVAHRGGEPCPRCGTAIARAVIRQRGTYYCPSCQPV
ncbi:MAG: bifunctional DNA-formamidopyrimidine glycosylase/DNA-(apurinic or apyrimidinic site) lyase [Dehalococcoidia bacterium]|nr:bifunctional DNA-formamidopyrimidine glycosylase/DNA-(apurinic or apyrimidinic site) lyase [Dehalococcoidia bacterium]MDD5494429.1 bifunctional DNA-formamidopyrimidine glycosylase/DNA-(apurinic or apyrimidinic site) lyase [Dehalococcoidia bacterium]